MNQEKRLWIGIGGAGNNILKTLSSETKLITKPTNSYYLNFSSSDIASSVKGHVHIIQGEGTGRSRETGIKLLEQNQNQINKITEEINQRIAKENFTQVIFIASLGGGTGSSLLPHCVDKIARKVPETVTVIVGAVLSSKDEGSATLASGVKSFNELFNNYVVHEQLIHSLFLIDNQKFENFDAIKTYDFPAMNEFICTYFEDLFDEKALHESADGYQTLDKNEYKRIIRWSRGLADIVVIPIEDIDPDRFNIRSSLFHGIYKYKDAKSICMVVRFKHKSNSVSQELIDKAHEIVHKTRKRFSNSFFVFGFNFDNSDLVTQGEIKIISNGIPIPSFVVDNVNRAKKSVGTIKKDHREYDIGDASDLDF